MDIQKEYYNSRYLSGSAFRSRSKRYQQFLEPLHLRRGKLLLDIGCGEGHILKIAQGNGLFCYGIDISEEALKLLRHQTSDYASCKTFVADGHALPFRDGIFNYVTAIGALEHFSDLRRGIEEIIRVCRGDGKMCLVLPNSFGPLHKLGVYMGTEQIQEKLATLNEWLRFLEESGMEIIYVGRDRGPDILRNLEPHKIMQRLFLRLTVLMPLSMAYQFVFICQKMKD